jgi:hypothetical protein
VVSYRVIENIGSYQEELTMRWTRKIKIFTFAAAAFAVLMLASPGYSWNGGYHRGYGGHYRQGYHNSYGHRYYSHDYHKGHWRYGYHSRYHAPAVSFAFPFPLFLPGFSFYIGP